MQVVYLNKTGTTYVGKAGASWTVPLVRAGHCCGGCGACGGCGGRAARFPRARCGTRRGTRAAAHYIASRRLGETTNTGRGSFGHTPQLQPCRAR